MYSATSLQARMAGDGGGMTIETKFKPGDTVFFMHKNAVKSSRVHVVEIRLSDAGRTITVRVVDPDRYKQDEVFLEAMGEKFFFATKEDLLASL